MRSERVHVMRAARRSIFVLAFALSLAGAARAEVLINIDKSAQRMTVSRDGEVLYTWPVSTGAPGHATPSGTFKTFRMEADHFSKEWDDAPMPYSIFFTQNGMAVHGTYETKHLGMPVSHGCVRLSPQNAATLFKLVKEDGLLTTKVVLTGSEQVALARRGSSPRQIAAQSQPQQIDPRYSDVLANDRAALAEDADAQRTAALGVDSDRGGFWPFFWMRPRPVAADRLPRVQPYPGDEDDDSDNQ